MDESVESRFSIEYSGLACRFGLTYAGTGPNENLTGVRVWIDDTELTFSDELWKECVEKHSANNKEAVIAAAKEYIDRNPDLHLEIAGPSSSELNNWTRTEVFPLLDSDEGAGDFDFVMAWKLLERCVKGQPFYDQCTFAWAIMTACERVGISSAKRLAFDAAMRPASRFEAMSLLIKICAPTARNAKAHRVVRELLSIPPEDHNDRYHKAGMIESAILNDIVWRICKRDIRAALSDLLAQEDLTLAGQLITRASCKAAISGIHRPPINWMTD